MFSSASRFSRLLSGTCTRCRQSVFFFFRCGHAGQPHVRLEVDAAGPVHSCDRQGPQRFGKATRIGRNMFCSSRVRTSHPSYRNAYGEHERKENDRPNGLKDFRNVRYCGI